MRLCRPAARPRNLILVYATAAAKPPNAGAVCRAETSAVEGEEGARWTGSPKSVRAVGGLALRRFCRSEELLSWVIKSPKERGKVKAKSVSFERVVSCSELHNFAFSFDCLLDCFKDHSVLFDNPQALQGQTRPSLTFALLCSAACFRRWSDTFDYSGFRQHARSRDLRLYSLAFSCGSCFVCVPNDSSLPVSLQASEHFGQRFVDLATSVAQRRRAKMAHRSSIRVSSRPVTRPNWRTVVAILKGVPSCPLMAQRESSFLLSLTKKGDDSLAPQRCRRY